MDYCCETDEGQSANELLHNMLKKIPTLMPVPSRRSKKSSEPDDQQKLEEELSEVKVVYAAISDKVQRLQKDYELLKKEADEKTRYVEITSRKKADLENQYTLLSKSNINIQNEELLETTKLRYKALRNITQVRFSFQKRAEDILEGCVYNFVWKSVTPFSIHNVSSLTSEQVFEKIKGYMESGIRNKFINY